MSTSPLALLVALLGPISASALFKLCAPLTQRIPKVDLPKTKIEVNKHLKALVKEGVVTKTLAGFSVSLAHRADLVAEVYDAQPAESKAIAKSLLEVDTNLKQAYRGARYFSGDPRYFNVRSKKSALQLFNILLLANDTNVIHTGGYVPAESEPDTVLTESTYLYLDFKEKLYRHLHPSLTYKALCITYLQPALHAPFTVEFGKVIPRQLKAFGLLKAENIAIVNAALSERVHILQGADNLWANQGMHAGLHDLIIGDANAGRIKIKSYAKESSNNLYFTQVLGDMLRFADGEVTSLQLLGNRYKRVYSNTPDIMEIYLGWAAYVNGNKDTATRAFNAVCNSDSTSALIGVFLAWIACWTSVQPSPKQAMQLRATCHRLLNGGLLWPAGEIAAALAIMALDPSDVEAYGQDIAETLAKEYGFRYLVHTFPPYNPTDALLALIEHIAAYDPAKPADVNEYSKRLAFFVNFDLNRIKIKEQSPSKNGGWTPGRVTNSYAYDYNYSTGLPPTDVQVLELLEEKFELHITTDGYIENSNYGYSQPYEAFNRALYALAGHPNVMLDPSKTPVNISEEKPSLSVIEDNGSIVMSFKPANATDNYTHRRDSPQQYTVYKLNDHELELSQNIGPRKVVAGENRKLFERTLPRLRARLEVVSDIDLDTSNYEHLLGRLHLTAFLLPLEHGYRCELKLNPLSETDYLVAPGEGLSKDIVTLNPEGQEPKRVVLQRDLSAEAAFANSYLEQLPALATAEQPETWVYELPDPSDALSLLLQLRDVANSDDFSVEYPKGQRLRLVGISEESDLSVRIEAKRDWFAVSGKLRADEGRVLDFQQLLRHARQSKSGFIQVGEDEFIALSEQLLHRVEQLAGTLMASHGVEGVSPLATEALGQLLDDLDDVEYDRAWYDQTERLRQAREVSPVLPKGVKADLRHYQQTGFEWMMRLAAWGAGACLADDMGLGKTIQALAVLEARKDLGPALVLAPASVTRNWLREAKRFVPKLNSILQASAKTRDTITKLKAGDVLIVSYGLLPYIDEELQATTWATVVLDEAQAIKNPAAQRSRAVVKLEADFRIATTGTPIENNLTELWSLFRFLNPGLLGSLEVFNNKFARPLSVDTPEESLHERLRELIRPFILRRRKDEVLKELPPKTEINIEVELSEREVALYEAIRREAKEAIETAPPQQRRFLVLQQLMRMRQAACHPKLVRPQSKLASAKLNAVMETLAELKANGHRVLIFSQFVKHLRLCEARVKATEGFSHLYLDGSTPSAQRQKLVDSFQRGEADAFLISLKAGGTGLNLTAADYVLHLDPWWNPAVEDQASDRAHRIGQQRPVTVYRFISVGTIEEQILSLHASKRALADGLLSGTDAAGSLSLDDMVELVG